MEPRLHLPSRYLPLDSRFSTLVYLAPSLFALSLYFHTLAPSVTWKHNGADSGDLVAAAFTLGIPHPPGYPLFTLLASLFARLPFFEPARGVAILGAIAGALAIFALGRAGAAIIAPLALNGFAGLIPPLAALGFAFAPALWSQATIAEVYTINLLFVAIILSAMVSDDHRRVAIAATAFGLGLAHHMSIVLFAPGAWLALKPTRRDLSSVPLVILPLLLYAYLPWRAAFSPPVNWGNPNTLEAFLWVVTAVPYRSYLFDLPVADIAQRVAFTARLLFEQFTLPGVAAALWGASRLALLRPRLAGAMGLSVALVVGYSAIYGSRDSFIYLLPAFAIVLLWLIYGAADLAKTLEAALPPSVRPVQMARRRNRSRGAKLTQSISGKGAGNTPLPRGEVSRGLGLAGHKWAHLVVPVALAALVVYNLWANFAAMDVSTDREAYDFARGIIENVPRDAVIFADGDEALFALVYYRNVIAYESSDAVIVSQGLLQYAWYYDELRSMVKAQVFAPLEVKSDYLERAREIVRVSFANGRTVCFTKSSPLLPEFRYQTREGLSCVVGQGQ